MRAWSLSRSSLPAVGVGVLGVVSVGAIATGLWYDDHRGTEAVERARAAAQTGTSPTSSSTSPVPSSTTATPTSSPATSMQTTESTSSVVPAEESAEVSTVPEQIVAEDPGYQWTAPVAEVPVLPARPADVVAPAPPPAAQAGGTGGGEQAPDGNRGDGDGAGGSPAGTDGQAAPGGGTGQDGAGGQDGGTRTDPPPPAGLFPAWPFLPGLPVR